MWLSRLTSSPWPRRVTAQDIPGRSDRYYCETDSQVVLQQDLGTVCKLLVAVEERLTVLHLVKLSVGSAKCEHVVSFSHVGAVGIEPTTSRFTAEPVILGFSTPMCCALSG